MPSAEIITIGTELLLGDILDTNTQYLAQTLRENGIDLYRTTTIGDNMQRIAQAIRESLSRAEIIITTGGLGPTVDDPTRDAVALAFNVKTEFHPELWEQIQERFARYARQPTENNKRQAYIPQGAIAVANPVGTAPAFFIENMQQTLISLPGVPQEMEYLTKHFVINYLRQQYQIKTTILTKVLHTAGIGESQLDNYIGDLETLSNPTVGLAAHSGQVDIRITVKAENPETATQLIDGLETEIRSRVDQWIYGADHETLEFAATEVLANKGWKLATLEAGSQGELAGRFASFDEVFIGGEIITDLPQPNDFEKIVKTYREQRAADVCLGVAIYPQNEKQDVLIVIITPTGLQTHHRPFGGPPRYTVRWAINHSINLIRNL
ncbi:MAG: CinA family nicotinamide mononucleotide deamidase-related protein [Anaerolineales bacterium]|nr:CinA family nicotinamide mononucleotide deamidase-related protein [Anaerolineales bacterium]